MQIDVDNPQAVVEEAFWLAWQACGGPMGMGMFQDRGPGVTKEQVLENVRQDGDYPGSVRHEEKGMLSGDYVFGRMMKLTLRFNETGVQVQEQAPSLDYEAWCGTYESYEALIRAAIESLAA